MILALIPMSQGGGVCGWVVSWGLGQAPGMGKGEANSWVGWKMVF